MATIIPAATTVDVEGWLATALALALAGLAWRTFRKLRGTTLAAPAVWAIVAALALAIVEAALAWRGDWEGTFGASLARYAAAAGTFCPVMAVLGAKRPQDRGWQWVVLSLWIVLLVPAGQAWLARRGGEFKTPVAWFALLSALLAATPLNYLPTRWAPSAVFFALLQFKLIVYFLPGAEYEENVASPLAFFLIVLALQMGRLARSRPDIPGGLFAAHSQRWLAFRNGWGAFWGLRILNRINETATLSGWPVRLTWSGFAPAEGGESPEIAADVIEHIQQTMDTLLRRFERLK